MNMLSATLETTISELKSANNELKKDIEKKEEIDRMRKEFLSNVSHELKTPLALIQGYAEGLQECINDDEESRDFYCEVIMDEADKMNQMVKKLLTLNQLEFGNDSFCVIISLTILFAISIPPPCSPSVPTSARLSYTPSIFYTAHLQGCESALKS